MYTGGALVEKDVPDTRKRRGHKKRTLIVDIWLLILDPNCGLKQEEFASYNGEKRCDWSRREIKS